MYMLLLESFLISENGFLHFNIDHVRILDNDLPYSAIKHRFRCCIEMRGNIVAVFP